MAVMIGSNIEKMFFGRKPVLELLKRRVIDLKEGYRQNVALLGPQYVGKSSILQHFILNFDDKNVAVVYLDLEEKDFNYLTFKFTTSLLYSYARARHLSVYDDINLLLEVTKDSIPNTVQVIKKILSETLSGKHSDALLGLLALPEIFTTESGMFCMLVFDEFQCLGEYSSNVFKVLGKKIMTQKKCFYVMASSYPVLAKQILSEKLSLLFGNFELVEIEPFNLQESQSFIEHCLDKIRIGVQLKSFLADFTGGHPLYLALICREMINLSAIFKQNEIYMPLLAQAVENTIFDKWGVISRHFDLLVKELCSGKIGKAVISVLVALSSGRHKFDEIVSFTGLNKSQCKQRLSKLIETGVVEKNGNFYYVKNRLFRYWIKYVYHKRLEVVELLPDKQRRLFREEFNKCVDTFRVNSRKDFSVRIMELFYCFDNEAFNLNGRRYRLPVFTQIEPLKLRSSSGICFDVLKAITATGIWFVIVKKETFCDNDLNVLLTEIKRKEVKPDRFLIVSLSEPDDNVKLRVLQEKFWIWTETELNDLLAIFDKPYILG